MTRCKDGRKRVVVQEYMKKNGIEVPQYIRDCPSPTTTQQDQKVVCCVCEEKHDLNETYQIKIKGETKNICQGCADIVHGLA